ncbi:MAG: hypothetical protein DBX53_07290 [Clostridiales bacterium]|jgi:hypothetical protein|nr:MAG: hypothetical protein DBX53_07290 [Clostridiales bacterium]
MNHFKKSFRGYRVKEVEERIAVLETQLAQSRAELAARENEHEKLNAAYERLLLQLNDKKSDAESIGKIYLKAFESGKEIAAAPLPYVKEFLDAVSEAAEKSRGEMTGARDKIEESTGTIAALLSEIRKQTERIEDRLGALTAAAVEIDSAYAMFERIKGAAGEKIHSVRTEYENSVEDYIKNDSRPQGPGKQADLAEKSEIRGAGEARQAGEEIEVLENAAAVEEQTADYAEIASEKVIEENSLPAGKEQNEAAAQPSSDQPDREELTADTYSDFSDSADNSDRVTDMKEGTAGSAEAKTPEILRGENIFNLINKYKKAK